MAAERVALSGPPVTEGPGRDDPAAADGAPRAALRWPARAATWLEWAACVAAGTALSWWMTGHVFGRSNNVFHLPIAAALGERAGFAQDPFVQSLAGFASGLWMVLEGSDAWWPAPSLFAWGLVASKALTLAGALAVARALGLAGFWPSAAFVGVLATTPLLQGTAYAGHGGLFVDYFSHSELANGFALLMARALLTRRLGAALALLGAIGFLNAFMAAWSVLPWAVTAWAAWRERRPATAIATSLAARAAPGQRSHSLALGLGAAAAVALLAPVAWRLATIGAAGPAAEVDLRAFVRDYYPYHFLAGEMPAGQWLGLAAVLAAAFVGLHWLRGAPGGPDEPGVAAPDALAALERRVRDLRRILLAYVAVYAMGLVAPLLSAAPWLIQLHLLRVSVHFHFIAAIVLALLLVRAGGTPGWQRLVLAPALLTVRPALVLLLPAWLLSQRLSRRPPRAPAPGRLTWGGAALVARVTLVTLVAFGVLGVMLARVPARLAEQAALQASSRVWRELAQGIGERTPPGSAVLLPLASDTGPGDAGSGAFEYFSGRPVWVDQKRGAAVLWQPAYHATWRQRRDEVAALADVPQRLAYASTHGLAMVVERCDALPAGREPELRAGPWCALRPEAPPSPAALAG